MFVSRDELPQSNRTPRLDPWSPKRSMRRRATTCGLPTTPLAMGLIDLIVVNAWVSHLEVYWEQPRFAQMLSRFAVDARVINFDKRGTGLSDRINRAPDLEARMDDIRAVMDAASSQRAVLFGWGDGAALASLFAATYPDRAAGLILCGGNARMAWAPDYPWGLSEDDWEREHARMPMIWGREEHAREWAEISWLIEPQDPDDPELLRWAAKWARYSAAPGGPRTRSEVRSGDRCCHASARDRDPGRVAHW
jgi:pimeloyl-ACP methyl ester carboxylesterase